MRNLSIPITMLGSVSILMVAGPSPRHSSVRWATLALWHPPFPPNGDVNPYGVAIVPVSQGALVKGNVLVSNFNNSQNLQGTGTTIVQISSNGALSVFAHISANSLSPRVLEAWG
jgi:hypothetical protein